MLLEAVPNLSLGPEDPALDVVLEALEDAASPGWAHLDTHTDPDHNRTVLTLAGAPVPLLRVVETMVDACFEAADLEGHTGVHPRVGLVDVVPFVALHQARPRDAKRVARQAAVHIAGRDVPVYFYGDLVPPPGQARLAQLRARLKGPYHAEGPLDPMPDMGPDRIHPRHGVACVGARSLLIAYNVVLDTTDKALGDGIARTIREKDGGMPGLQAMAFPLEHEGGRIQVSCNITDVEALGPADVFARVRELAAEAGVGVVEGELVGLAPDRVLPEDPAEMGLQARPGSIEDRLAEHGLPPGARPGDPSSRVPQD